MTDFGIWLIERINNLFPSGFNINNLHGAKKSVGEYQTWEEEEAIRVEPEFGPHWNVERKSILDIGCGLGGKPIHYARSGARCVHAIDIRHQSTKAARELSQKKGYEQLIYPITGDASALPYSDNSFDVIVSINVFEHVENLFQTLSECKRVLDPEGLIFLHFPPFYSPWGPHLEGWINFPWPHLFFSDKTLIRAAQKIEKNRELNNQYIPTAQIKWAELIRLPDLNRTTARQFFKMINHLKLEIVEYHMLPFGRHLLLNRGVLASISLSTLRLLAKLPLLREVVTTKMVFVLGKGKPI